MAAAAGKHPGDREFAAQQNPVQIHVDNPPGEVVAFLGEGSQRHDASVVDKYVQRSQLVFGFVQEVSERRPIGDVELHADAAQLGGDLAGQLAVQVADRRHPRASGQQRPCGGEADTASAAGDRDGLSGDHMNLRSIRSLLSVYGG